VVAELDRVLTERLQAAHDSPGVEKLRRFLAYFGKQPATDGARRDMIERLASGGRFLEAELLRDASPTGNQPTPGPVMVDLADWFAKYGRRDLAASCYEFLAREYPDEIVRDGKNGAQLLASLPGDSPIRREITPPPAWRVGQIEAATTNRTRANSFGRFIVPYQASSGPFFADTVVRFDQNRPSLLGFDGIGRQRWEVHLSENGQPANIAYNPNGTQVRVLGHLMVLSTGAKVLGIDPLGVSGNSSKVLWTQDMNDADVNPDGMNRIVVRGVNAFNVAGMFEDGPSFRMNPLGPCTDKYVCFQRFRNLVVVDPLTGEPLWIRQDIPPNSEIFGDDQYIFVLPPQERDAMVFRAIDGESLGKRNIPAPHAPVRINSNGMSRSLYDRFTSTGMTPLGRCWLTWEVVKEGRKLQLFDVWEQRPAWPDRVFSANAKASLVGEEVIGVFEPDGHFTLLSLSDGRVIGESKLTAERTVSEILVTRLGDQYFLLTNDTKKRRNSDIQPLSGTLYQPIARGRLYALDLRGKPMWPEPVVVENQEFLLSQPSQVPVLAFACRKYEARQKGTMTVKTRVMCVDRRNGHVVYDKQSTNSTAYLDLIGNPDKQTVELQMQSKGVVLTLTDKPVPPGSPSRPKAPDGRMTDALMEALEAAFGGSD